MDYYRERASAVIEAYELTPANAETLKQWTGGDLVEEIDALDSSNRFVGLNVPTRNGFFRVSQGQYLICRGPGDFSVMSAASFHGMYERTSDG